MNEKRLFGLALLLTVLGARTASAQELCPVAQIGSPCDDDAGITGGTCVAAACTETETDGGVTHSSCATCIVLTANVCPSSAEYGEACGDGGMCVDLPFSSGGPADGPTWTVSPTTLVCVAKRDSGATDGVDGGVTEEVDAGATAADAGAGAASEPASEIPANHGGCSIANNEPAGGIGGSLLGIAALVLCGRRGSRRRRA